MSRKECIYTASCTANCSLVDSSLLELLYCFFVYLPLPVSIYIYFRCHSRSISNRYGSLLSAVLWQWGLSIPLQGVTVRPTHGNEMDGPTTVAATSLCIACDSYGSNVANEAPTGGLCMSTEEFCFVLFRSGHESRGFGWRARCEGQEGAKRQG